MMICSTSTRIFLCPYNFFDIFLLPADYMLAMPVNYKECLAPRKDTRVSLTSGSRN